jgi:malonate transporter
LASIESQFYQLEWGRTMFTSLGVIAPVIAIIATGFLAALFGLFSAQQVATMNRIVFLIAAPALLFRNVVLTQIPELIPWGLFISYYGAMFICLAMSLIISLVVFAQRRQAERVIIAFGSCFSNTVMLGIPIILTAFGAAASLPLFLILAFHGLLVFSVGTFLLELSTRPQIDWRRLGPEFLRSMASQQIIIALLAGVIWNFTGIGLTPVVDQFLELLGQAAIPLALLAVGGLLARTPFRASLSGAAYMSVFKLVLMPLMVFASARYLFDLPPIWVASITVLSAMPTGVFTSVFASRYQAAEQEASSAIALSSVAGIVTISAWLIVFQDLVITP